MDKVAVAPRRVKLAAVTSHPVQYQAPLFQALAKDPKLDLHVFYGHDGSVIGEIDREFGVPISWDRPLLTGYHSEFLTSKRDREKRWKRVLGMASIIVRLWNGRYDAVLIHSYATLLSLFAYVGAKISGTPILLRTESHRMRKRRRVVEYLKRITLTPLFHVTDAFLVIGEANREFFLYYGVAKESMFFTPYCVDNTYLSDQARQLIPMRDDIKRDLDIPLGQPVFAYSGKLIELKRVADLIEAIAILKRRGCEASLLIIGDGPLRQELLQSAIQANISAKFVGFQNQTQLARHYVCADVLVLPSTRETWGLVLNEAMAVGIPIVTTTAVGASLDLVDEETTGYTYTSGDVGHLARLLERLSTDSGLRQRLGRAAFQKVQRYSYQECVKGILSAIEFVTAGET